MGNAMSSTSRMSYIAEMTRINAALGKSPFVNGNCTIRTPTGYRRFMRYVNLFPQLAADNANTLSRRMNPKRVKPIERQARNRRASPLWYHHGIEEKK